MRTTDVAHEIDPKRREAAERALEVLSDSALEPIVDMVLLRRDGAYEAVAATGTTTFRRLDGSGPEPTYEVVGVEGADPLAQRAPDRFVPLEAERAHLHPRRRDNAYPHAYDHTAQLFDHPAAPDLCVLHSADHNWEDQGGHRGEHGSLGVIQARAPFVLAGKGVRTGGLVGDSARLVDVAPTIAALLGCAPHDDGSFVAGQDGVARTDLLDGDRPRHVVGFLFDGTNSNVLYAMAASGEAPNVARLLEMGIGLEHGAIASLPTVTLANHTTIITGRHPGHHGILHNAWYDRSRDEQIITNSTATWPTAMQHLLGGVESIHDAVHRTWEDAFTAAIDEPCDVGADFSTFDYFRRGEVPDDIPSSAEGLPHSTERFVRPSKNYGWSTIIDHMAVEQACGIWDGHYRDTSYPAPRFMFVNFALTDAAMHEGGPHSDVAAAAVRDTDARMGEVLAAVERAGVFDETAFLLVADHGMEETDPAVTGDWGPALREAGISFRDEGYGFIYVDAAQGS